MYNNRVLEDVYLPKQDKMEPIAIIQIGTIKKNNCQVKFTIYNIIIFTLGDYDSREPKIIYEISKY